MAYTAIGDKTVQNFIDMLSVDSTFNSLLAAQQLQYINFSQQECAVLAKQSCLGFYKVTEDMKV